MNNENLVRELKERGIETEEITVVKNNVECRGIRIITESDISPVIYYSPGETLEQVYERVQAAMSVNPGFDVERITSPDYIRENVYLAVQKKGPKTDLVTKELLNLEQIMYVRVDGRDCTMGKVKVTGNLLKATGIDETELWEAARGNTGFETVPISEILGFPGIDSPFCVVRSREGNDGAAALAFPELFRDWCMGHGEEGCYILPSSTEELLLLPYSPAGDGPSADELATLVEAVNSTEVDPVLQLEPVCYSIDMDSCQIVIAGHSGTDAG